MAARKAAERAINAEPWEPLPGMIKLRCSSCHFWFAAPDGDVSLCPDCFIREQRKRAAPPAAMPDKACCRASPKPGQKQNTKPLQPAQKPVEQKTATRRPSRFG